MDPAGRGLPEATGLAVATRGLFADDEGRLHPRTLIRRHVVAALRAEAGALAGQVHPSRVLPLRRSRLPAVLVYANKDSVVGSRDDSVRIHVREVELVVEIVAAAAADLDEILDSHALAVERIVQSEETQGGNAEDTVLADTKLAFVQEGETLFGSCQITFKITYAKPAHEDIEPNLALAGVRWDVGPEPDSRIDAEDRIAYEE